MSTIDPTLLVAFRNAVRAKIRRDLDREEQESRELRERVLPVVRREIERARASGACRRVWLFGSFAWGTPVGRSDVDLLVEGAVEPDRLAATIGTACVRDVHVIELERAPDDLRRRVLSEGTPL